jgi:hypothetical protein
MLIRAAGAITTHLQLQENQIMVRALIGLAFACLLVPSLSLSQSAQGAGGAASPAARERLANRAVIMKVEKLSDPGARAIVIRRPTPGGTQDFILVDGGTAAGDLARAVGALMYSRRKQGSTVAQELRANIAPAAPRTGRKTPDEITATRDLARLRTAPVQAVPGVGTGRVIRVATAPVKPRG